MDHFLSLARGFEKQAGLKEIHKEEFVSSSQESVNESIHAIQSQQEITKAMMNMGRMKSFLTGMAQLESILGANENANKVEIMAYVWGPVQFLLRITWLTSNHRAFDNLLDVYEQLGNKILPLEKCTVNFIAQPEITECLVYIYEDVLQFHRQAYRLFSLPKGLWEYMHIPTWKALEPTFEFLRNCLEKHGEFMQKVRSGITANGGFDSYCNDIYKCRDTFEGDERQRKEDMRKRVISWIAASKKTSSLHKRFQDQRIYSDRAGRFLFRQYSEVTEWIREEQPPDAAIWLQGSKGFGKTILASLLVDELKILCTEAKKYIIPAQSKTYYFYCQEDDPQHCTFLSILRGLLHQMVEENDDLLPLCAEKADTSGNINLDDVNIAKKLIEAFHKYNTRQYIIVDGLDECVKHGEASQTAHFFVEQVKLCENEIKQGQLRVLFMSQPIPELFQHEEEDISCIKLREKDNAGDIRNYVRMRINESPRDLAMPSGFNLSEQDKQQMEDKICSRSQGMFLYAHLAVEYLLLQPTKEVLLEKIATEILPTELSKIYERLLGAVKRELLELPDGEHHWQLAKLLLGWLVCANRSLKWHEMQAILSFDAKKESVDFDTKMLRQKATKYLGSLVHILDGNHMRIIHSTARNFIIQNEHIKEKEVQLQLATLCLEYLCLLSKTRDDDKDERRDKARRGWFSFQDYACSQWHIHVYTVIETCSDILCQSEEHRVTFGAAVQKFVEMHHADLMASVSAAVTPPQSHFLLERFARQPFYESLQILWQHIKVHDGSGINKRNTVGITRLDEALQMSRETLETNFKPTDVACIQDTIEDYYGANLFKCKRLLCPSFYLGYEAKKDRDAHDSRHERPFPCPVRRCSSAPIGFLSKKDRDRHVRCYHPDRSEGPSNFEALQSRKSNRRFVCNICKREFTRNLTLKGHERSHFGQRPYACAICDKRFARSHDLKRHSRIHARGKL